MAKMSVLIIDDEEPGRILVRQYLDSYAEYFVAGECANGLEAISLIDRLEPDLIFLDIQMPGANGFEVLQRIGHVPRVIFTTAYDNYAIQAFETNATDYLLKPYTKGRFEKTMAKLQNQPSQLPFAVADSYRGRTSFPERILVECKKRFRNIQVNEIIFLRAFGDYTEIHSETDMYISSTGITVLTAKLNPEKFLRIHRSTAINVQHIAELYRDIGKTFIVMNNGTELTVGRNYLPTIKDLII
ncbi:LytR/AlgR family response regulator transcription factor [Pedobacter panaciterrae]|uniref:Response regulator n=1 Tax=Pedobacter panaciterrae TaxID=363849 RepID=A0ABU8NQ46_9SPHI|nr:response regulator [Pedobacter panaciterrae]NQX54566.1 response regulator [Pedobacter panaciterrae]